MRRPSDLIPSPSIHSELTSPPRAYRIGRPGPASHAVTLFPKEQARIAVPRFCDRLEHHPPHHQQPFPKPFRVELSHADAQSPPGAKPRHPQGRLISSTPGRSVYLLGVKHFASEHKKVRNEVRFNTSSPQNQSCEVFHAIHRGSVAT
jgi:hypothetical protein